MRDTRPRKIRWYFSLSPAGIEARRKVGLFTSALWLTGSRNKALHSVSEVFSPLPWKCIILNQLMNLSLHILKKDVATFTSFRNGEA